MKVISKSPECKAARELGLTFLVDKRGPPSPRGSTGHCEWEAPDGLLAMVPGSSWNDPEAGSGRRWLVLSGPHEGRIVAAYGGSGWFQPALTWA